MFNQKGGMSPDLVWAEMVVKPNFLQQLQKDSSLKHLDIDSQKIDLEKVRNIFLNSDPTEKKKYLKWIIEGYSNGANHMLEDVMTQMPSALKKFTSIKKQLPLEQKDIFAYCGLWECGKKVGLFSVLDRFETPVSKTQRKQMNKKDADKVYEDEMMTIIHPKTKETSQIYGQGTKWCTAGKEDNMFDEYNKDGPLYIMIPKHPIRDREKYQFHPGSHSFMDETDEPISFDDLHRYLPSLGVMIKQESIDLGFLFLFFSEQLTDNDFDLLLSSGADPNAVDEVGKTLLHMANNEHKTQALLKAGANPNAVDKDGMTPLHMANNEHQTQALLKAGANPNAVDKDDRTPLRMAENEHQTQALLKAGANPNAVDKYGVTPLHMAKNEHQIQALLKAGANPNAVTKAGGTPLHCANNERITQLLLEAGADPDAIDEDGGTPLHNVKNERQTQLLLKASADPNVVNIYGRTPLHYAKNERITQLLLEAGADPDTIDEKGVTPLHYAKNAHQTQLLLEAGADPNVITKAGRTPLHIAKNEQQRQLLLKAGAIPM